MVKPQFFKAPFIAGLFSDTPNNPSVGNVHLEIVYLTDSKRISLKFSHPRRLSLVVFQGLQ